VRAAIFHAPGDVRIEERPVPRPGPGEVLLRVDAALTDGTDAKAYRRGHPLLLGPPPAPFGHEYAGTVEDVGAGAPFRPGDRVAGANSAPCGRCAPCRRDREAVCRHLLPLLNGAYAEYLLVPAAIARVNLHPLPSGLEPAVAALCEPLACALHGVEASEARPGERVVVLGRGPMARLLAMALDEQGCEAVLLSAADDDPEEPVERVIEAAGSAEAWQRAVRLLAPGGTAVLFGGLPAGTVVPVDAYRLHYEALTLRGAFHHAPRHVRGALDLVARDPERFRPLITHRFALADVTTPLAMAAGLVPRDGLVKALIDPWAPARAGEDGGG
jgi:L-iditol 2-dehydrogenase